MIELDYVFRPEEVIVGWDWASAPDWAYAYDAFPGDVHLLVNGEDLSAPWGWVTVLYFALCLQRAVADVEMSGVGVVELTESELTLVLSRADGGIEVRADWVPQAAFVELGELRSASDAFAARVRTDFERTYPATTENPRYREFQSRFR